jgi:hypothetical protein
MRKSTNTPRKYYTDNILHRCCKACKITVMVSLISIGAEHTIKTFN